MSDETAPALLLTHGRIIDPASGRDETGGILIENGVIRDVGPHLDHLKPMNGVTVRHCAGAVIAPGLVDMRVFVGEPGEEHRETFRTAGLAAAAGGITTMICQPQTLPPLDDAPSIDFVKRRAKDRCIVRVHPMAALTKGCAGGEMTEIGLLKEVGAVAYTDGARAVTNAQVIRRALTYGRMFDALIVQHCEDPDLVGEGVMNEGEFAARLGLPGAPDLAETVILERDMRLLAASGGRYHAALISCSASLDVLRKAKEAGLNVTAGVSINHLTFNENDVGQYRTFFKLAPPLRTEDERLALVEALASGLIDVIVSDHNPQDVETKRLTFAEAANGAAGLETMLSAGLRLVEAGHLTLPRLIEAMTLAPSRILHLPSGTLSVGAPADVIVFDPEEPWVCDPAEMRGRSKNTPFDEARMAGRVKATIVGGRTVFGG
ncbi:MAG: dihydroorotase [Methylocystis sp.]|nr:dihydroorotase [Methylocystis sp.]MCA3582126.1 dihydroorotase [Methylocystis sp.]MCA3586758.1 dihydroorotase [Methylocystis sp.]MCA3591007.1 dihydroorotase [Methylocystis sp.]